MIQFDEKREVFKLDTPSTSYIMGIADGKYLGHIYYGKKLKDTNLSYLLRTEEGPFTPSKNPGEKASFFDTFASEYPCGGIGDFRESCIDIKTEGGQEGLELVYESYEIIEGKKKLEGLPATWGDACSTLEITLRDVVTNLKVVLSYTAFDDVDVITRSARIVNEGKSVIYLNKALSACLTVDAQDFELLTLNGSWARERHMDRKQIGYGSVGVESLRGISGHQEHPFMALLSKDCNQNRGEVYAMHFVYSSNFLAKVQKNQFDMLRAVMGIHDTHFCWKLEPESDFQTPEVVMVYSCEGLGKMTRTLHDLYRNHLIRSAWKDKKRPVLINNWEATYFDFNTEKLLSIAKTAAEAGIEMLVMDDGWFGHRQSDNSSLGDWDVNEEKIQGGLKYLVDEVNKLGLKFGIWFEPEMISPDSNLYKKHPEWALHVNDREPGLVRTQLVLDLSRPEVVDYVYECVAKVLRMANIEYVKWDMNRPIADIGSSYLPKDQQGEIIHRHMLAVYELQERLMKEFPNLLLENCTSGGARFDPGMLYFSPQFWCSDDTDAVERLIIQEGTQLLYPLSTIGAHVSDCPNHSVGRVTPFETRGTVALAGTFGYELDITKISKEEQEMIPGQIEVYNKYNKIIREGDYYRIASYQENHLYDCYEVVSKDKKEAFVTFTQVLGEPNKKSRRIKLYGLDENAVYEVEGKRYFGDTLMNAGLLIERPWGDFKSKIIDVKQV